MLTDRVMMLVRSFGWEPSVGFLLRAAIVRRLLAMIRNVVGLSQHCSRAERIEIVETEIAVYRSFFVLSNGSITDSTC